MTEIEALLFLENLAAIINDDMGLGLSVPVRRRIAERVLDDDPEGADATARHMTDLMLSQRTLH